MNRFSLDSIPEDRGAFTGRSQNDANGKKNSCANEVVGSPNTNETKNGSDTNVSSAVQSPHASTSTEQQTPMFPKIRWEIPGLIPINRRIRKNSVQENDNQSGLQSPKIRKQ